MKEMVTEEQRAERLKKLLRNASSSFFHRIEIKPDLGVIKDTHCDVAAIIFILKVFPLIY